MQADECAAYQVTLISTGVYTFKTDINLSYSVTFISALQFADKAYSHCIYELSFYTDRTAKHDSRVMATIADILKRFFTDTDKILFYLCDSSDGRHYARKRLFDRWIETYSSGRFIRYNADIIKPEYGIEYLMQTISHHQCPYNESLSEDIPQLVEVFSSCK